MIQKLFPFFMIQGLVGFLFGMILFFVDAKPFYVASTCMVLICYTFACYKVGKEVKGIENG